MAASSLTCPICVDSYEDPNDICSTVCGHIFHHTCLLQWQEQSNTCPMCNRTNPAPHRIFIDLKVINDPGDNNEEVHKVVIKGIPPNELTTPLSTVIVKLFRIMQLNIQEADIGNITKVANTLHVSFKNVKHKDMFLSNKFKLKKNPQTSALVVHEEVDPETKALFRHSHKLKDMGYKIFFIRNKKVYVKKDKNSVEVNITSKEHVDRICGLSRNRTAPAPTAPPVEDRQEAAHTSPQYVYNEADWRAILQSLDEENDQPQRSPNVELDHDRQPFVYDEAYWREVRINSSQNASSREYNQQRENSSDTMQEQISCCSRLKNLLKKLANKIFFCC